MSLPYFPYYPKDFEAKTSHLTLEEDGAYNRLLRLCWMSPVCSLPDDDSWIMRRMRVDQETYDRVVRVVLEEFFERKNGRVSNATLIEIFNSSNEAHKKRVSAGAKGGKAKSLKTNKTVSSNARAMPKQPEPEPNNTPYSPPRGTADKPPKKSVSSKAGYPKPDDVEDSVWRDFLIVRKKQKAEVTETSMAGIIREANKAGYSLNDALRTCCERGWRGFKADWVKDEKPGARVVDLYDRSVPAWKRFGAI